MSVYIEWMYEEDQSYNPLIIKSVMTSLEHEEVLTPVEVSVSIVDNEGIREINLEQRQLDKATDVLSFPMIDYDPELSIEAQVGAEARNPENDQVYLGDIVISWDKVLEQSGDYGHSLERELSFLVVHSMLHLLGYDHMNEEDEAVMLKRQKGIMKIMGLER